MRKTICFAYYADGIFVGWYADSFGSIRKAPKLYSNSDHQIEVITKNFSRKIEKITESSFAEAKEKTKDVIDAIQLASFDSEELLKGKKVVLRAVECPYYDGENPDFDKEAYEKAIGERHAQMKADGVFDIPAPSKERSDAVRKYPRVKCDNWTYADYNLVKEWAKDEPKEFLFTITP